MKRNCLNKLFLFCAPIMSLHQNLLSTSPSRQHYESSYQLASVSMQSEDPISIPFFSSLHSGSPPPAANYWSQAFRRLQSGCPIGLQGWLPSLRTSCSRWGFPSESLYASSVLNTISGPKFRYLLAWRAACKAATSKKKRVNVPVSVEFRSLHH